MTKLSPKFNENANESSSKTQKALILKALQQGDRLTHLDAEQGHKIEKQMIVVPSGKCVAEYRLVA